MVSLDDLNARKCGMLDAGEIYLPVSAIWF